MQKVKVYLSIDGDYVAFHEISFVILFDITNGILFEKDYKSLENIERIYEENEQDQLQIVDAILIDGEYFISQKSF
jgi:hypothetical protein